MCKLKFVLTSTRIKLGSLFFGRYFGSSRKVVKPKNGREEDHTQVWHRIYSVVMFFRLGFFFYVHVFCPFNEKQTAYWKSLKFVPSCFSNFWSTSNHKWRRQQLWHLTEGFICTLAFIFLRIYSLLYAQKIQECDNQKFKVLRTQTFSHVGDVKFKTRANKVQINR